MNDDELRSAYAALRRARAQRPATEQPTTDAMRAALDGELPEQERERVLAQALSSGASAQLALLQAAHVAASGALPSSSTVGAARASLRWWPLAAAAALVLAIGVPVATRTPSDEEPRFRAAAASAAPQLIAPASGARLSAAQRFVWSAVPGSTSYTLELLDANGRPVAQLVARDTTVRLGPSVTEADRARTTGWWVTVVTSDGRRTRSELRLTREH